MRYFVRLLIVVSVIAGIVFVASKPLRTKWAERNKPHFRTEVVTRGDVINYVNATGKIRPVETIKIGSFVSGPIKNMPKEIDFNKPVSNGQVMAQVDPRLFRAQKDSALATWKIRLGDVDRTKAQLQLAKNDENRAIQLRQKKRDFVSQAEMDQLRFAREQLEAALVVAEASVEQAAAQLEIARINLAYTDITAPKDGVIIDRKIDPGQTIASQFQTPELFEIGIGMDEKMHIYASVDEIDIGLIKQAQATEQPVTFTVNAYPTELFTGRILQIRMSSTETQSVVTYPVIVEAPNRDGKLLPGMTADLSFKIEEHNDVLRVPNQALRYFPDKKLVREEDHKILDGSLWNQSDEDDEDEGTLSADNRALARQNRNRRHVWIQDGDKLRAVAIETGLADQAEGKETELVSGELDEGQALVVGEERRQGGFFGSG